MKVEDPTAGFRRELARGTVELAILSLLVAKQRYGYELLATVEDITDGAIELKEGTLYPVLHRLEDGGSVETVWEAEGRAAPRKYYRITAQGRKRLGVLRAEWERVAKGMRVLLKEGE